MRYFLFFSLSLSLFFFLLGYSYWLVTINVTRFHSTTDYCHLQLSENTGYLVMCADIVWAPPLEPVNGNKDLSQQVEMPMEYRAASVTFHPNGSVTHNPYYSVIVDG